MRIRPKATNQIVIETTENEHNPKVARWIYDVLIHEGACLEIRVKNSYEDGTPVFKVRESENEVTITFKGDIKDE